MFLVHCNITSIINIYLIHFFRYCRKEYSLFCLVVQTFRLHWFRISRCKKWSNEYLTTILPGTRFVAKLFFQINVSKAFSKLRHEEELFDVTLVSDDEVHISSHKLVLSACSDFFKNILRQSSHANPLIFLSGIKSKELNFVMDYIYNGEVQLYQNNLDSFLDIAQKLKIDGLGTTKEEDDSSKFSYDSFVPMQFNCSSDNYIANQL